jgi:rSAM/selenodomain-associated transferase 2
LANVKISIIIPALNERANLERAIARAWEAGADEIILSDGGSTDGTWEAAARLACRRVRGPAGRARQQNAGAALAQGDVLLFQHADNWLEAGAARQIEEALASQHAVCGAFRQKIEAPGLGYRLLEWGNALRVRWQGLAYGDQNIFLTHQLFRQIGGFPDVPLMEDLLLMRVLRRRAWPVLLPGPLHVDARRWRRQGIVRQTARNWSLVTAWRLGVPLERLTRHYPRHDEP